MSGSSSSASWSTLTTSRCGRPLRKREFRLKAWILRGLGADGLFSSFGVFTAFLTGAAKREELFWPGLKPPALRPGLL